MDVKYPHIKVQLIGQDGNGFGIISKVSAALRQAKVPKEEVEAFMNESMDGDYNHLLQTVRQTVTIY